MSSIPMQGETLGRLAAESIIRESATQEELNRQLAAFLILLGQIVELKREEEGEAAAAAFEQGARNAIAARFAELDALAEQTTRTDQ